MSPLAPTDPRSLAASLAPVLVEACQGRLSDITWFRTDWQRGGAATGRGTYELPGRDPVKVVIKLPVVGRELLWMRRLQDAQVVPQLYASGETLGDYDLAWLIIERFEFGPLGAHWDEGHTQRVADAAARFYVGASSYAVDQDPSREPWDHLLKEAQESLRINDVPNKQRWRTGLKSLRHRLKPLVEQWEARPVSWLHGDLHLANAMSRSASGPVFLIDLAEVHPGHWVEDAVYLERQLWARPQRLKGKGPVKAVAAARKVQKLDVDEDHPRLAMIRRALLAGTAPKYLKSEGDPRHLEACLDWLERALAELK